MKTKMFWGSFTQNYIWSHFRTGKRGCLGEKGKNEKVKRDGVEWSVDYAPLRGSTRHVKSGH